MYRDELTFAEDQGKKKCKDFVDGFYITGRISEFMHLCECIDSQMDLSDKKAREIKQYIVSRFQSINDRLAELKAKVQKEDLTADEWFFVCKVKGERQYKTMGVRDLYKSICYKAGRILSHATFLGDSIDAMREYDKIFTEAELKIYGRQYASVKNAIRQREIQDKESSTMERR